MKIAPRILFSICFFLFIAPLALGLEVQIATESPPFFVDQPIRLQMEVTDCQKSPEPSAKLLAKLPQGVTLNLTGVTPQISSYSYSFNGRVQSSETVKYYLQYQVVISKPGPFRVGPFEVSQGNESKVTKTIEYEVQTVKSDPNLFVEMNLDADKIYVGQRVPLTIRWGYSGDAESVRDIRIRAPMFDQFAYEDLPIQRGDSQLTLQTIDGEQPIRCDQTVERIDGKRYVVCTMKRTLIADKAGKFDFDPISTSISLVTRWGTGGFFRSSRTPVAKEPRRATGEPSVLEVLPLPPGAPASFAGAVGNGFRMEVNILGNTIVNVGDPIKVRFLLSGKGNLAQAGLPKFNGEGGFDVSKFRLPQDEILGSVKENTKEFIANIRVTDESVNQIPPLAYSWFNPKTEKYETAYSKARALTVDQATVVSSNDVVTAAPNATNTQDQPSASPTPNLSDSLADADLAITMDPARLLNSNPQSTSYAFSLYVAAIIVLGSTFFAQRRKEIDPLVSRQRKHVQKIVSRLKNCGANDSKSIAQEYSASLRQLLPLADGDEKQTIDAILAKLETIVYSPNSSANEVNEEFRNESIRLAEKILQQTK